MPCFPAQITELETSLSIETLTFDGSQLSFCLLQFSSFLMFALEMRLLSGLEVEADGLVVACNLQAVGLLLLFLANSFICEMTVNVYPGCLHDNVK